MKYLSHIALAVKQLEISTTGETALEGAARRLAYDCLRTVILGSNGVDTVHPSSSRLHKETEHFSRKRVKERIQMRVRELTKTLATYPNEMRSCMCGYRGPCTTCPTCIKLTTI